VASAEAEAENAAVVLEEAESVSAAETDTETLPAAEAAIENVPDADESPEASETASGIEDEQAAKEDGA
jgi:hypothetical protein